MIDEMEIKRCAGELKGLASRLSQACGGADPDAEKEETDETGSDYSAEANEPKTPAKTALPEKKGRLGIMMGLMGKKK
jgi:hypothetical protein